jgi:hypothetical protein
VLSSRTATLLTPSSLIRRIASRVLAVDGTETTAVYRNRERSWRACSLFVRYWASDGVMCSFAVIYARAAASVTKPWKTDVEPSDRMRTANDRSTQRPHVGE